MRLPNIIIILINTSVYFLRFPNIIVIFNQTLLFIFNLILSPRYIMLYIILLKYIYISKKITNLNANNNLIKINYI